MFQNSLQEVCQELTDALEGVEAVHNLPAEDYVKLHLATTRRLRILEDMDSSVYGGALNKESSRLIMGLAITFQRIGNLPLGIRFCRSLLGKVRRGGNRLVLAKLLNKQGSNYLGIGLYQQALANLEEARSLFDAEGEEGHILGAMVTMNMGLCYIQRHKYEEAFALLKSALAKVDNVPEEWFERCSDKRLSRSFTRAIILGNLGNAYLNHGEDERDRDKAMAYHRTAEKHLQEAIELGIGGVTFFQQEANLALNHVAMGELEKSEQVIARLADFAKEMGFDQYFLSILKLNQVEIALARQSWMQAHDLIQEALEEILQTGDLFAEDLVADSYLKILKAFTRNLDPRGVSAGRFLKEPLARQMMDGATRLLGLKDSRFDQHHSRQVADMAVALGQVLVDQGVGRLWESGQSRELNRAGVDLDLLRLAANFHDIGKIKLPWSVLNLPGETTEEERSLQEQHVKLSKAILEDLGLGLAAQIVAEHHERNDGSGYPMGTNRLSLMGSILALAEAYVEGTTLKREWGERRSPANMVMYLQRQCPDGFDSQVLEALPAALECLEA